MQQPFATLALASLWPLLSFAASQGQEATGWRNDGSGLYPDAAPPLTWHAEPGDDTDNDRSIVWKTRLSGASHATPLVAGGKVFMMCEPAELVALDADSGEVVWRRAHTWADVFPAEQADKIAKQHALAEKVRKQIDDLHQRLNDLRKIAEDAGRKLEPERSKPLEEQIHKLDEQRCKLHEYPPPNEGGAGNATATPVAGGEQLFAVYGNGIVACYDLAGERRWIRFVESGLGEFAHAASPLLVDGKLIVQLRDLVALDTKNGDELWRAKVPKRWGTPALGRIGEAALIVTPSGCIVRASDGEVLAKELFDVQTISPLVHDGVIYAGEQGSFAAWQLPDDADGEVEKLWDVETDQPRLLGSPLVHEGLLYTISEQGILVVRDAETGDELYTKRLRADGGQAFASPAAAGGRIYIGDFGGELWVIEAGDEYRELAKNKSHGLHGSPAFAGDRIYVRGRDHLYCIGE